MQSKPTIDRPERGDIFKSYNHLKFSFQGRVLRRRRDEPVDAGGGAAAVDAEALQLRQRRIRHDHALRGADHRGLGCVSIHLFIARGQ